MNSYKSEETAILEAWKRLTNQRFLEWQQLFGERKTVTEFAEYLGFPQSTVSFWLNGSRVPKKKDEIDRLSSFWGLTVYDALKMDRPDEDLYVLKNIWQDLDPEKRRTLREQAEKYNKKKKRWLDLYEEEKLDPQTLTERIQRLDDQLNEANAKLAKQRASQARHESNRTTRTRLAQLLDNLEGYYLQAPPVQVNADLHNIIERVVITKDQKIKIHWRGED